MDEEVDSGKEEDLSRIEVVGKNGMDISLISEYSKNILKRIAKNSNNPVVVITDVSRTPSEQAERMYNLIEANGILYAKNKVYSSNVHSVLNIYDDLKKENKKIHFKSYGARNQSIDSKGFFSTLPRS